MESVKKFNALDGNTATRQELQDRIALAKKQEQNHIAVKLQAVLDAYPEEKAFKVYVASQAHEIICRSELSCYEYQQCEEEYSGLGKAVSPGEIYDMISSKMVELIKSANSSDYKKKWQGGTYGKGYLIPFNFKSKKRYRGVNVFLLTEFQPIENPFFLTFKQVEELGGIVKKGSKGFPVVYFTELFKVEDIKKEIDFGTYDKAKAIAFAKDNGISESEVYSIPILKYYNVFNGADIEGIDFDLENFKTGYIDKEIPSGEENKMPIPEAILNNYPKPVPPFRFGGDKAFYSPGSDFIQMPHLADFETSQDYYRTFFHEIGHSTGHQSRLGRDFSGSMNASGEKLKKYAFEELIAEWCATFLSAEAGIIWHSNNNHAAYLKSWNKALTYIENDNRFVMRACTLAQKAADFVLQYDKDGQPKYFADLKKITEPAKPKAKKVPGGKKTKKEKPKQEEKDIRPNTPQAKPETPPRKPADRKKPTGQMALFGSVRKTNAEILEMPVTLEKEPAKKYVPGSIAHEMSKPAESYEYYEIGDREISEFLGKIEKKKRESLAITLAGGQGSMKTRMLFRLMNAFGQNYRCGHASIEEHPSSAIYKSKVEQYLNQKARENIFAPEINSIDDLYRLVGMCDIVFIDSFPKLQEMCRRFELDKDLRKKFDGKLFIVIYQLTGDGKMRGGSKSQFDGDIILMTEAFPDYTQNYVFANKNRYQDRPLHELKYNIYQGSISKPEPAQTETKSAKPVKLSFDVIEY